MNRIKISVMAVLLSLSASVVFGQPDQGRGLGTNHPQVVTSTGLRSPASNDHLTPASPQAKTESRQFAGFEMLRFFTKIVTLIRQDDSKMSLPLGHVGIVPR